MVAKNIRERCYVKFVVCVEWKSFGKISNFMILFIMFGGSLSVILLIELILHTCKARKYINHSLYQFMARNKLCTYLLKFKILSFVYLRRHKRVF